MITYKSQKQLKLEGFETPFEAKLDANNRWVKLSQNMRYADFQGVRSFIKLIYEMEDGDGITPHTI